MHSWMGSLLAVAVGFVLDLLLGDPNSAYHPICLIGRLIAFTEKKTRALFPKTKTGERTAGGVTALIVVLLAPFVEEVLFRGLVFGCLKEKSRIFAYILSCALFAFLHVWTAAVSNWDLGYLILMLQYLVPGLVFAWAYEHSGTLWTSILLHMLVNALSLFTIAS